MSIIVFTYYLKKLPEEVRNYTGILSVKNITEQKFKRDVNLSAGFKWRNWSNAPIYYRFYFNPRVQVRSEIGKN